MNCSATWLNKYIPPWSIAAPTYITLRSHPYRQPTALVNHADQACPRLTLPSSRHCQHRVLHDSKAQLFVEPLGGRIQNQNSMRCALDVHGEKMPQQLPAYTLHLCCRRDEESQELCNRSYNLVIDLGCRAGDGSRLCVPVTGPFKRAKARSTRPSHAFLNSWAYSRGSSVGHLPEMGGQVFGGSRS